MRGREEWEKELDERIAQERRQCLKACERVSSRAARYSAGVEAEVVKLALAIAARVLHREAKLDPLLLTGGGAGRAGEGGGGQRDGVACPVSASRCGEKLLWRADHCCRLLEMSG